MGIAPPSQEEKPTPMHGDKPGMAAGGTTFIPPKVLLQVIGGTGRPSQRTAVAGPVGFFADRIARDQEKAA
jgi:hypothetical protein